MFRLFENIIDPYPKEAMAGPPANARAFIGWFIKATWPLLTAVAVFAAAIAVTEVMVFKFLGQLVDWLTKSTPESFFSDHGVSLAVMGAILLVALPLCQVIWQFTFHQGLMGNLPMMARWRMHTYLLRQSIAFFQDDMAGRIANTVMQTSLAVRESITKIIDIGVYVLVYFLSALALVFAADWRLAVPLMGWLVGYIAVSMYFVPRLQKIAEQQADARSVMTGRVVDSYSNILTVKLFAHTDGEVGYARESMTGFMDTVYRQMRLSTQLNIWLFGLNYALLFAMSAMSIWLWSVGAVTPGDIAIAIALVQRLQGMSQWILWEAAAFFENIGTVQDGVKTLSRPLNVTDAPAAGTLAVTKGEIRYDDVTFHYGRESGVLDDFTLTIKPQERVGLVGPSGAGTSTLTSLLLRLYDVERGRVLIDGQDISAVAQESLRAQIGVVTQDTALHHRSVAENIRYGRPGATDAEVIDAAKRAHAHAFILALEDGKGRKAYDAHVGERGVNLSGGQRQRIAIARVLLKDAPILVLDEATSALDSEVEAAIQESLAELMRGKTVIAIAHRLSTIARMDRLVVLEDGQIVEDGHHTSLVNAGGLYARLWSRQTDGFLPDEPVELPAHVVEPAE